MGIFSRFEDKMEDTVEGAASRMSKAPISPVQIAKKAERQMRREVMVGAGKQYAPTLYTILVNPDDDERLFGYYPTLAGETETYLKAKASQEGLVMDGNPLVRFIVDDGLRHGKFDVIAEMVAAPIVSQLRDEEMERYGIIQQRAGHDRAGEQPAANGRQSAYGYDARDGYDSYDDPFAPGDARDAFATGGAYAYENPTAEPRAASKRKPPLPYVPEDEIDRSIDYGEYTFNSKDFEDYRDGKDADSAPFAYNDDPDARNPLDMPNPRGPQRTSGEPSSTIAFTPGAAGGTPDHRRVSAQLVDRGSGRRYDLAGGIIRLGRESGNDIKIADINASRRHAELRLNQQGLWVVSDLNSMNGTTVNGVSVASQPLYPGDVITIGRTDLEFTLA